MAWENTGVRQLKSYQSNKKEKYLLPREVVDNAWRYWLGNVHTGHVNIHYFEKYYPHSFLGTNDFKDWLFTQGISVKKIDREYYLEFSDKKTALWHMLKWG
jgi:hypothetical protein